jgi:hypothetical protein
MSSNDPLGLSGLEPDAIDAAVKSRETKGKDPVQLQMQVQKEQRLADKEKRLAGSKTAAAAVAAAPPPPPPAKLDVSATLDKIYAYRERFAHLKSRNKVGPKSSPEEVLDELHYIELQLGSQNSNHGFAQTALYCSMVGIERSTDYFNPLGLDLTGLGRVAQSNMADFQPILDELMIKYQCGAYTSPETRLVLMVGALVVTVNAANQNPETAKALSAMASAVKVPVGASDL